MRTKVYDPIDYGAKGNGRTICTQAIQEAIDAASENGGSVVIKDGVYLTGSIFIKSNMDFIIDENTELRGIVDDDCYPEIQTRIAGVEMKWPAGLINVIDQKNVRVVGGGIINGQGEYWWNKFWGEDKKGGMLKTYEENNLRWAADYDCKRPRNIVVYNSSNVDICNLIIKKSPFWNVHICYSKNIHVEGLIIKDNRGPSTDGIDVDSSEDVLIEKCNIECNDDNLCIKSGRDADGLRVNKPCRNIVIRDCKLGEGEGITLGSETSGGISNIEIANITANNTLHGIRFKSAKTRGGIVQNILIHDINLIDVANPFIMQLNWNPSYSYCSIPKEYEGVIPEYWNTLCERVAPEKGIPEFKDIDIINVKSINAEEAFIVDAFKEKPIKNLKLSNIEIQSKNAGYIKNAVDWEVNNILLETEDNNKIDMENCVNVDLY